MSSAQKGAKDEFSRVSGGSVRRDLYQWYDTKSQTREVSKMCDNVEWRGPKIYFGRKELLKAGWLQLLQNTA